jgi:uncharacterized membrane protein YpjA
VSTTAKQDNLIVVALAAPENEARHRLLLRSLYALAIAINLAIFIYGFDYYRLAAVDRPFSPKHHLLRPSGPVGLFLGFFAVCLFMGIFLYPLRKKWSWLSKQGNNRHWLNIHIAMGLTAPVLIAFHSTLKFRGIAGMSFWFMFSVALSGVIGRYLYVQIPRSLNAAELTRKEVAEMQAGFARQLEDQNLLPQSDLQLLMKLPSGDRLKRLPLLVAVAYMMVLDVKRMFHLARLRRHAVNGMERVTTLGGLLKTRIGNLERAIETAREEASLSKRILFLSYSQRLFHLWHVVHKPFSYTFIILAVLHIGVQFLLGYL